MNETRMQKFLRILVWLIGIIAVITIGVAWVFYAETYDFFNEAISNLGGILSYDDKVNNFESMLCMTIGFGVIGIIALSIAIDYISTKGLKDKFRKAFWALVVAAGAAGIAIPHDYLSLQIFHYFGAFAFVLGFGILNFDLQALGFFRKRRENLHKGKFHVTFDVFFVFVVFAAIALYFVMFILESPYVGLDIDVPFLTVALSQKIVLIANIIAIFILDVEDM